ncbi:MAG: AAA family ATPase [Proteobacteria bacterium]|nr:AAA family ATPase [Pseudomonadota bacterium]
MDADRPVTSREHDRLGFAPVAEHLATVIADTSAKDGLVLGIEGAWGSGKSSIISLTKEALRQKANGPEVIDFAPWLVGARNTLLGGLFDELAAAAAKIDPVPGAVEAEDTRWELRKLFDRAWNDEHWKLRQKQALKKKLGSQLVLFGALAGTAGRAAKIASEFGVPGTGVAAHAIEDSAKLFSGTSSLAKQKRLLVKALAQLSRPIVVFVDDLDRLEPHEAAEVLRLIRAVADFPNVIYVLSYDPVVVAKTLEKAVQVDDGAAFLEKIVQASFRVPRPQAFDLRFWFRAEVEKLFGDDLEKADSYRLAQAIDVQGGQYLTRPRDVVRALNALRLHALPVRDNIDIPDMIWLQLTRIGKPGLYAWVEEYMTNVAAIVGGAAISNEAARAAGEKLTNLLSGEGIDLDRARIDVATMLPGLGNEFQFGRENERPIYNNLGLATFTAFIQGRRLGSPQHFRYYFAFAEPAGALKDEVVQAFIAAAQDDPNAASRQFETLMGQNRPQGGTMAEVLIDRLLAEASRLPQAAISGVIGTLARHVDSFANGQELSVMGRVRAWGPAENLITQLFRRADAAQRAACIDALFTQGPSLGWITSILRSEIFAHGLFGDRPEPADQWLLTEAEFNQVLPAMLQRFRDADPVALMNAPELISLLYGWFQGGDQEGARAWVRARIQDDGGLLDFLARARGWRATGNRVLRPLNRRDLGNFLDYDVAIARLGQIENNPNASAEDRQLARELLDAARADRRDD